VSRLNVLITRAGRDPDSNFGSPIMQCAVGLLPLGIPMTGQLSGVVLVPCRCPGSCQVWYRYPAGALAAVWSGAGTPQVPCQEWCRYPAGATSVRSGAEIGLLSLRISGSQRASLGDFLHAPACPIKDVTLWIGSVPFVCMSPTENPTIISFFSYTIP